MSQRPVITSSPFFVALLIDSIGFGIILPVMPPLIMNPDPVITTGA